MPFPNKTFKNNSIAIEAGRKGGKNYTEKQRITHTLTMWKRHGIKKKCGEKVMAMMASKEFTGADWYKHIDTLEEIAEIEPKFIPILVNMKKEFAKFIHPESKSNININTNDQSQITLNVNTIRVSDKSGPKRETDSSV